MNIVNIDEAKVREAAKAGMDEFVDLFANSAIDSVGGSLTDETMAKFNSDQMTLIAFKFLHDEVMDGGFVQLIYNGFGPFIFFNPFAKAVREWGLDDLAALVNKQHRLAQYPRGLVWRIEHNRHQRGAQKQLLHAGGAVPALPVDRIRIQSA